MNILRKLFGCKPDKSEVSTLAKLSVIKGNDYPCDKCSFSGKNCWKLHFADSTICVCKKEDVKEFAEEKTKKNSKK